MGLYLMRLLKQMHIGLKKSENDRKIEAEKRIIFEHNFVRYFCLKIFVDAKSKKI